MYDLDMDKWVNVYQDGEYRDSGRLIFIGSFSFDIVSAGGSVWAYSIADGFNYIVSGE